MKLGKYKGLQVAKPDLAVNESEIDRVLKNKQHEFSLLYTVDDRAASMGDEVQVDYDTECDGQPIPRGKARNYKILLGSHTFVKGFEEAIVGHEMGDQFDVSVVFPENYRMKNLAGKEAVFHVRLNKIFTPEFQPIDDEFAKDFSEFETLAEWREEIREEIRVRREASAYEKLFRELLTQVIEGSKIPINEDIKTEIVMDLMEDFVYELEENGMSFATYCQRSGMTKQQIRESKEIEAIRSIQEQSVLHAIANKERLEITDEELAAEIYAMSEEEGEDPEDFAELLGEEEVESIIDQLLMNKAMQVIYDNAIQV